MIACLLGFSPVGYFLMIDKNNFY